jgi:hypothetical protein
LFVGCTFFAFLAFKYRIVVDTVLEKLR